MSDELENEEDDDDIEFAYYAGTQSVYRELLRVALTGLGINSSEWEKWNWLSERADTIGLLRTICKEYGDNAWEDDLHLRDIIAKHLLPYIIKVTRGPSMGGVARAKVLTPEQRTSIAKTAAKARWKKE